MSNGHGVVGSEAQGLISRGWECVLVGAVVYDRSMVNWRRGYVCPRYMCILLYVKLTGVMVLHGCMLNWGGPSAMDICAFLYM